MRKTRVTLYEGQIEFLADALESYYKTASEKHADLASMKYEDTIFHALNELLYKAAKRCNKQPSDDLYEITGGYLGDGVYVSLDGKIYNN